MFYNAFTQHNNQGAFFRVISASLILFLIASLHSLAIANTSTQSNINLAESRILYKKAHQSLRQNKKTQFKQYKAQLEHYPLFPYLLYAEYSKNLKKVSNLDAIAFIDQYADSPVADRFKKKWLAYKYKTGDYGSFLTHYVPEDNAINTEFKCFYGDALLKKGQTQKAYKLAEELWTVGKSQPKSCDKLFNAWKNNNELADAKIWYRIQLAMRGKKLSLAKYLASQLKDSNLKTTFKTWEDIYKNPAKLANSRIQLEDTPNNREIILQGFARWIQSDKKNTLKNLAIYLDTYQFTQEELDKHVGYIGRYISFSYHPQAYYWLMLTDLEANDPEITDKKLMVAINREDWAAVLTLSNRSDDNPWDQNRFDYSYARALEKLSANWSRELISNAQALKVPFRLSSSPSGLPEETYDLLHTHSKLHTWLSDSRGIRYLSGLFNSPADMTQVAQTKYNSIASFRNYYGFLSSRKLGRKLSLNENRERYTQAEVAAVANIPAIQRAHEFYMLNEMTNARREWYKRRKSSTARENAIAARIADTWGWHFQAILTAALSNQKDNLEIRFPKAYQKTVAYHANKQGIRTDWVFSVIRQESAFKSNAMSHVGAVGMMQLMPATAKYVSNRIGVPYTGQKTLLKPENNIRLGTAYLKELSDEFDGNILMATAAYNAGPHRVRRWRPKNKSMDGDLWVETIPFAETQDYVKNIVTYQAIYKHQLGQVATLTKFLDAVHPKTSPVKSNKKSKHHKLAKR